MRHLLLRLLQDVHFQQFYESLYISIMGQMNSNVNNESRKGNNKIKNWEVTYAETV